MLTNNIGLLPAENQILINDGTYYTHNTESKSENASRKVCHTNVYLIRTPPVTTTIWPGDFIEVPIPPELNEKTELAIVPRYHKMLKASNAWPTPEYITPVVRKIIQYSTPKSNIKS